MGLPTTWKSNMNKRKSYQDIIFMKIRQLNPQAHLRWLLDLRKWNHFGNFKRFTLQNVKPTLTLNLSSRDLTISNTQFCSLGKINSPPNHFKILYDKVFPNSQVIKRWDKITIKLDNKHKKGYPGPLESDVWIGYPSRETYHKEASKRKQ